MILINLTTALICFAGQCYPALTGNNTPVGTFPTTHALITAPGYGGDVLVIGEITDKPVSIHRVWTGKPAERRVYRLHSTADQRRKISAGCVNVMPDVYNQLIACCAGQDVRIER